MTLTKNDLNAIRGVVKEEIKLEIAPLNKKIDKLKIRFDELFDFLDKKYIEVKKDIRHIQNHLHLPVSEF